MRKRILSALLAVMFLFTGLPGTAWAVGEGNMEAGGGQTDSFYLRYEDVVTIFEQIQAIF